MTLDLSRTLTRLPSTVYLWLATLIFAASNSVTQKIIEIGEAHLVNGRNPISLCNVLFVGNICAFLLMVFFFHREYKPSKLKKLDRGDWFALTLIGILSGAIAPALFFSALDGTSVTNVVLISRLEPLVTLILSIWLLGSRVNQWTIIGSVITFIGVVIIAILGKSGQMFMGSFGRGELFVALAAVVSSIATIISKLRLQDVSLGIFSIYRTVIGTVVFFVLANILYGREHFAEALSPVLWGWMLVYAAIIVVLGQLCWLMGLKKSTSGEISLASSFNPVLAIAMAFLILGEKPSMAQYWGGAIIFLGILFNLIGTLPQKGNQGKIPSTSPGNIMSMMNGFQGF